MINVTWLADAMEKAGFRFNKDLAEAAGVSGATVGNALKRGEVRESTAEKLQAACGEHAIGPLVDTNAYQYKRNESEFSVAMPEEQDEAECLERFEGTDCPTSSATCVGCYETLLPILDFEDRPRNRAACRLLHGWRHEKGSIFYVLDDGEEVSSDYFVKQDSN